MVFAWGFFGLGKSQPATASGCTLHRLPAWTGLDVDLINAGKQIGTTVPVRVVSAAKTLADAPCRCDQGRGSRIIAELAVFGVMAVE